MLLLRPRSLLIAVLILPLSASLPTPLRAQEAASTEDERALQLYQSGETAFGEGHFEAALVLFEQAYTLSRRPGLLYNMAICADRLRRDDDAIRWFEGYLAETPSEAPNRVDAAQRHDALVAARARRTREAEAASAAEAARVQADAQTSVATSAQDVTQEAWFWGVLGGGAALVVGGIVVGVVLGTQAPSAERGSDGMIITALTGSF
jgi:hypothetical protein